MCALFERQNEINRLSTIDQQNRLQLKMGLECTKAISEGRSPIQDSFQSYRRVLQTNNSKEVVTFFIKIDNLRFLDFSHTFHKIKIEVQKHFTRQIFSKEFTKQDKIWICGTQLTAEIKAPISDISNKVVSIEILDREANIIDQLKLKLYHLSVGPVKHDHLLKSLHSRLLFDFNVDQFMNVEISLNDFEIVWKNPEKYAKYSYFLSLIFSNTRNHIQATKKYEKHQKIKGWGLQKIQIKNSQLSDSIIKLKMANTDNGDNNIQCFIPYSKFAQQTTYRQISNQEGSFQARQLTMKEDIVISGENVGSIRLIMGLTKSKLFAQQMDCVIYSQNGIVMTTETDFHELQELNGAIILDYLTKLRNGKSMGMSDHQFFKLMVNIYENVQNKEIHITDDLFKVQDLLLDFMLQLSDLIEQDRAIRNQYIWKILHSFLHKKIMNLRYFSCISSESLKKKYSLKFYQLLIGNLTKIIEFINNGISFKEVNYIQRLPWCQSIIVDALLKKSDPVISEEKLGEIGASLSMKSPSRSFFYDYENTALKLIQREEEFIKMTSLLHKAHYQNQRWAGLLFDREYQQLFYGLYTELWDQAQCFLNNNGRVMWQYFPRYGSLLSIFLGEMNSNGIIDFSGQMTRCNMKLIMNQKLLNTFMMLIFPKTCLYQTYCVLKCLDLINCYFLVILQNNKKIPADFNYNYLYTGIRCILESNHSYLLQRMLAIIYKYYNIFSKDFRETLNHYINCKVFNQLFMHWSQNVRNIFHLLLIFRISKFQTSQNPEGCYKNIKSNGQHHDEKLNLQTIIQNLHFLKTENHEIKSVKPKKKKLEYYQIMKLKLKKKMLLSESLQSDKDEKTEQCDKLPQFHTPVFVRRKWSLAVSFQEQRPVPSTQEIKYLSMSLREFQLAKIQKNPDSVVDSRSKVLQVNIDQ